MGFNRLQMPSSDRGNRRQEWIKQFNEWPAMSPMVRSLTLRPGSYLSSVKRCSYCFCLTLNTIRRWKSKLFIDLNLSSVKSSSIRPLFADRLVALLSQTNQCVCDWNPIKIPSLIEKQLFRGKESYQASADVCEHSYGLSAWFKAGWISQKSDLLEVFDDAPLMSKNCPVWSWTLANKAFSSRHSLQVFPLHF